MPHWLLLYRSGMIQCSPKHTKAMILIVFRKVIITYRKDTLCRSGMIQCSPKHTKSCIWIVFREFINTIRLTAVLPPIR